MSIIRVKKDEKYFTASNEPFIDKRLSWEARGLMGYLLTKPNNWQVRISDLESQGEAGNHKIKRMLAELRTYGCMNRIRITLEGGKFDWITEVYESPSQNPNPSKDVIKTSSRISTSGSSTSGKLPDIVITDGINTESLKREGVTLKNSPAEPTDEESEKIRYDMISFQFGVNHRQYFDEFYRLTKLLPEGKKQLKEWIDACSLLWSAKVFVSDMEPALHAVLEKNFTVKNPGSLLTTMQTIKMRREKNVTTTPSTAKYDSKSDQARTALEQYRRDNGYS